MLPVHEPPCSVYPFQCSQAAILKIKMAAEDAIEKNGTNSGLVANGIYMQKTLVPLM